MSSNEKLVSGLGKLNDQIKSQLRSWELDIELSVDDMEEGRAKGRIQGYLKALIHMGMIDQDEAREINRFYVMK